MKGTNVFEFCEQQMCAIVEHWLRAKLSSHGEIGQQSITSVKVAPNGKFRCVLEDRPAVSPKAADGHLRDALNAAEREVQLLREELSQRA